ncbi:hypothetical protein C8R46DRAFT_1056679 [Mycena filopes]|nr:hypothetical protein C8R46DRAFT_1056679 [Mycena filopes]
MPSPVYTAAGQKPDVHFPRPPRVPTSAQTRRRPSGSLFSSSEAVPQTHPGAPRQLIPYLYLASSPPPPGGPWTHIIRLLPASKTHSAGSSHLARSALDLRLPPAAFTDKGGLHMTPEQLTIARDFLALALPYHGCSSALPSSNSHFPAGDSPFFIDSGFAAVDWTPLEGLADVGHSYGMPPTTGAHAQADPVRVLLLGPPRLALAVALVYIAHAAGGDVSVAQVAQGVLEARDPAWCALVGKKDGGGEIIGFGKKEMKVLERAARDDL